MPRTDFLAKQRKQISTRLDELRPLYEEYLTLEKAQQALDQLREPVRRAVGRPRRGPGRPPGRRGPGRPRARRAPGRPPGRRAAGGSTARAGTRRQAGGTRADQTLATIKANPGITIPELARKMRIRPNYLYRVTAGLQKQRRIRRQGTGFHAR